MALAQKFKGLTDEEKKPYAEKARKEAEEYQKAIGEVKEKTNVGMKKDMEEEDEEEDDEDDDEDDDDEDDDDDDDEEEVEAPKKIMKASPKMKKPPPHKAASPKKTPPPKKRINDDDDSEEEASSEEEVKAQKKRKDPNAPKRPKSPYICFVDSTRARVRAENPDVCCPFSLLLLFISLPAFFFTIAFLTLSPLSFPIVPPARLLVAPSVLSFQMLFPYLLLLSLKAPIVTLMKMIGEMWIKMSAEERAPFLSRADADRIRYQQEMLAYNSKK